MYTVKCLLYVRLQEDKNPHMENFELRPIYMFVQDRSTTNSDAVMQCVGKH